MKTHIKNLLRLLLLLGLPAVVQAQDAYSTNADGSIYTYSTNADGSAYIFAYAGPPWVVTIPTNINGLKVTGFSSTFAETALTSITIPGSVTSIGDLAFYECSSLTNVTIDNGVTNIGGLAFYYCLSLTSVTIPNSVTSIGEQAFENDYNLTNATIDNGVTSIGEHAFDSAGLTSVTIPNSVTSIGEAAFFYCTSLSNATIDNGVTSIGEEAFAECYSLTNVTIPGSVTSIGEAAFGGCIRLTSVYFTGNAPSPTNDSTVFSGDYNGDPTTVYYLPGTTGWGAMFDGLPTAPWFLPNPVILNGEPGFGVGANGFGFTISWATNASVVVEACTNLANPVWIPVSASTLTGGTNYFSDPQWTNYPMRFYRAALAFTVGGTLTGLPAGDTVTLQDNGSDNLTLSNNGTFTFPTALPDGQAYSVTVSGTSGGLPITCTLTNGSGTISGANVTNVAVKSGYPALTGNRDLDMYNAALWDGTANGGVPGVMLTENGGPFRVTALGRYSDNICEIYSGWAVFTQIVGTGSCSSTTFPSGTWVIQFGTVLECGYGGSY
jgi:BspA type Leucine rich repeat region (6 copies)